MVIYHGLGWLDRRRDRFLDAAAAEQRYVGQTVSLVSAGAILKLHLPGDDWRSCDTPSGTAFVRADDLATAGDPVWAQFAIFVDRIDGPVTGLREVGDSLVLRRVQHSYRATFAAMLAGVAAIGYEYTDGVADLLSYFAPDPGGGMVEICIRIKFLASGAPVNAPEIAADFVMAGLRWMTTWTVWRQDDNGVVAEVATLPTREDAQKICDQLEAKGHKQTYWVARSAEPPSDEAAQQAVEAVGRTSS